MAWPILVLAAAAAFLLARSRWWEMGPCPWCTRKGRGRSGRGFGSGGKAWNYCRHCGGKGERIRPLALIWPKHRETARKRKKDRSRR